VNRQHLSPPRQQGPRWRIGLRCCRIPHGDVDRGEARLAYPPLSGWPDMACDRWDRWAIVSEACSAPSSRLEPCLALIRGCAWREERMQPNALGGYRYPSGKLTRCRHAGGIGGREARAERRGLRGEGEARGIGVRDPHPSPLSLAPRPSPLAFIQAVARFDPVRPTKTYPVRWPNAMSGHVTGFCREIRGFLTWPWSIWPSEVDCWPPFQRKGCNTSYTFDC